jgi:hypothetical protein
MALWVMLILLNPDTDIKAPVTGFAMRSDGAVLRARVNFARMERRVAVFAGALI